MKVIPLSKGKEAIIDDEDYYCLSQLKWHYSKNGYALRNCNINDGNKKKCISMHRQITNCPSGYYVDHINHNPLDNRKENLRICSGSQNQMNKVKFGKTSKFKGVYRKVNRWVAQIGINGSKIQLGYFMNEEDAARAYNKKALELFGDFALINDGV